jgi:nitrite reductase (NADH) small subunit
VTTLIDAWSQTGLDATWVDVCAVGEVPLERGVAALIGDVQVALFRLLVDGAEHLFAVDHRDPAAQVNVMARGLLGSAGDVVYVASPLHKQRYDLRTGRGLDDDGLALRVFGVRCSAGRVEVCLGAPDVGVDPGSPG